MVIRSDVPLEPFGVRVGDDLLRAAERTPSAPFVAERRGSGWRAITYAETLERVRATGAGMLAAGASEDSPLAIVAENGIEFAVAALAAMHVGIPFAPISVGYARPGADRSRLRALLEIVRPAAIFVPDADAAARVRDSARGARIVTNVRSFEADPAAADRAFERVGADTVAKILFTSGTSGAPKGVITTQRMLCANQTMLAQAWPDVTHAPVVLDWMPWSHVAAGNKTFHMILRNGGTLYVDDGRPTPSGFARTLANVRTLPVPITLYFSVPKGLAMLAGALARDEALAARFFARVSLIASFGASLSPQVREEIGRIARSATGREVPVLSPYGATETAPMATAVWGGANAGSDTIGTPVPGVEIKLASAGDRTEIRVRGPNVTPGYWRDPDATASAFDDDGFYKTGDAGELADPADPARGIVYLGRIAENFKTSAGTWVNVGSVRSALIEAAGGAIEDAVIVGHDRDAVGALIFANIDRAREIADRARATRAELARSPELRAHIERAVASYNLTARSASTRVGCFALLPDEPGSVAGELTDKGTINQRIARDGRADLIDSLYARLADGVTS